MHRGYVKLWRKMRDHEMMIHEGICQLFLWVLLHARNEPGRVQGVDLEPGQVIVGRHVLAAHLKQNPATLYKRLLWLQSRNIVSLRSNNRHTVVTLVNWELYNGEKTDREQQNHTAVTERHQCGNNEVAQKKHEKHEKHGRDINVRRGRVFSPPTFEEWRAYCADNGYGGIADRSYRSYAEATPPWTDSRGTPIRSWKQKLQQVWFREDNKGAPAETDRRPTYKKLN